MELNCISSQVLNDSDQSATEGALIHAYPGSMPAYLASRLADRYSSKSDFVFDPFCGSGATLLESAKLGRKIAGTDLLEIAVDIVNSAIRLPETEKIYSIWKEIHKKALVRGSLFSDKEIRTRDLSVHHKELSKWFHSDTFTEVMSLYLEISQLKNQDELKLFSLLLASTLISLSKRVSRGVLHWGWIADNVKPAATDLLKTNPFGEMENRVSRLINFTKATGSQKLFSSTHSNIFIHNWVKDGLPQTIRPASVDLLLTSPPYPYSIDYTLALRLSHYLFEMPFAEIKSHEIGARYKRKRKARANQYLSELGISLNLSSSLVRRGGHAAFVLPHPDEYKSIVDLSTEEWLDFFQRRMRGNWTIEEVGFRDCAQRRLVNRSKPVRQEMIAAFKRR